MDNDFEAVLDEEAVFPIMDGIPLVNPVEDQVVDQDPPVQEGKHKFTYFNKVLLFVLQAMAEGMKTSKITINLN